MAKAVNGMDARRLRQAGRRMLEHADAEISRERARLLADEHEAALLTAEERRAEVETWLSLGDNGDGTWSGRFTIPELHGQMLRTALERLTSPRRLTRNRAGEVVRDDSVAGDQDTGGPSRTEMLGLGFTELIEHLPTSPDGLTGGFTRNAVTLLVHLDHQHLLDGLASARLDTGVHLSAGEARRLACNAGLLPVVLGGASQVLDLGRTADCTPPPNAGPSRSPTTAAPPRAANDPSRGATSTIRTPGARAARTDLANALPLCGFHHRRAHDTRFDLRRPATGEIRYRRRR